MSLQATPNDCNPAVSHVEFGRTEQILMHPSDPRTEDYITGRFG